MPELRAGQTVERDGKKYLVIGKTFGSKTKVPAGATVEIESEQANLERDPDGNLLALTLWAPEVMGPADGEPETLKAVVGRARKHGVLREKVRGPGGGMEYLPNESGDPATADKAVTHSGVAVGLMIPIGLLEPLEDSEGVEAEARDNLHVTLAFLGESDELEPNRTLIENVLRFFASTILPFTARLNGVGRFMESSDGRHVVWANFDSPVLPELRQDLIKALKRAGIPVSDDHGFTPHVTLAYLSEGAPTPEIKLLEGDFILNALTLMWADELQDFDFAQYKVKTAVSLPVCPKCGAPLSPLDIGSEAGKCDACGAEFGGGISAATYALGEVSQPDKDYYCMDCGAVLEDVPSDGLCPGCGARLVEVGDLGVLAGSKAGVENYPDESKKLRYVVQLHARGKSIHGDLRIEYKRDDQHQHYLRGWTIALQQPEAVKEPITALEQLKKAAANPDLWKMDLKTGLVKPRQIRGGVVRRGDLRAFRKAAEIPSDWLNVEGVTDKPDPGEPVPVGATREYPGVFLIVSKGEVFWGAQKPWFSEMWLDGDWKGRWAFRLVKREGKKWFAPETDEDLQSFDFKAIEAEFWSSLEEAEKADVLPPGVEEEDAREGSYFVLMQPIQQQGYVLSKEAIEEDWLPPRGISALPRKVREAVPKELRYWEQGRKQALESRRRLAEEYEELGGPDMAEKEGMRKFALARRDWKGQEVIRAGSSTVVWDLWVDDWRLTLSGDPLKGDEVAGEPASPDDRVDGKRVADMGVGDTVDVKPGSKFNPTKETPCQLEVLDKGDAQELAVDKAHRKYQFKGKELKGVWFFRAEDEEAPEGFWLMSRSEGPKTKEADMKEITVLMDEETEEKARGAGQGVGGPRQGDAEADVCVCPKCGREYPHEKGTPCNEMECEGCGAALVGKEAEAAGVEMERAVVPAVARGLGRQIKENIAASEEAVLLLDDEGGTVAEFLLDEYESEEKAVEAAEEALSKMTGEKVGRRIRGSKLEAIKDIKEKIVRAVEQLVKEVIGWGDYEDEGRLDWLASPEGQKALARACERGSAGFAFKGKDGRTWWFQFTTNAFQDREREIFSTKSLEAYVERHRGKEKKGEFWYRHIPGSKFGDVRWEAVIGRYLGQTGPFDDTPVGEAFKEFFLANPYGHPEIAPDGWGTSHKYYFNRGDKESGVYEWLEIAESSVLPAHVASNPWNVLFTDNLKEIQMSDKMSEQEKKDLETIGGQKLVSMVEELALNQTKDLEERVAFKAIDVIKELKAVLKAIEDEGLKKRLGEVIAKLESYPKPKAKEEEEEEEEEGKKGLKNYLASELLAIAKEVGGEAGKKIARIAEALAAYAYPYPKPGYGSPYPKPGAKEVEAEGGEQEPVEALTREEVFEAMKSLVGMVRAEIARAVKAATEEAVMPVAEVVREMQKADAERIAGMMQETPAASLDAMLKGLYGEGSAKVDGRTALAKQGPKETPPLSQGATGVPFIDMFISGADQRQGGSQ